MAAVAGERILICADVARFFNHPFRNGVATEIAASDGLTTKGTVLETVNISAFARSALLEDILTSLAKK